MKFSLTRDYLEEFLDKLGKGKVDQIDLYDLKDIIEGAYAWEFEVCLIVYFYTKRVQKKQNSASLDLSELEVFYSLNKEGYFSYQEFDREFVSYLFDYSRSKTTQSLEDLLVSVQQDFIEKKYDSDLRY
jgi:hypothetical protein